MSTTRENGVTIPQTSIVEREMVTVKWWPGTRMKVARFHLVTTDGVVTLDSLFVRDEKRDESYYIREAELDDIDDEILLVMRSQGYEPAQTGEVE